MGQQANKSCALQAGTSKDNGTSMGTWVAASGPVPGLGWEPPTQPAQEPLQEISARPAGSTWAPGWVVLFISLHRQHSPKEGEGRWEKQESC